MRKSLAVSVLFLFISSLTFAQKPSGTELRKQAMDFFNKGEIQKAQAALNKITDKELLNNTNVNVWKSHIDSILHYRFRRTNEFDSLQIAEFTTANIRTYGVYDARKKEYLVPPIYDQIWFQYDANLLPNYAIPFFIVTTKDDKQALLSKTGQVIIPARHQAIGPRERCWNDYDYSFNYLVVVDLDKYPDAEDTYGIYDLNGKMVYQSKSRRLLKNDIYIAYNQNKFRFIDLKTNTVLIDNIDSYEERWANGDDCKSYYFILKAGNDLSIYKPEENKLIPNVFDEYQEKNRQSDDLSDLINGKENYIINQNNRLKNENTEEKKNNYLIVKKNNKYGVYNPHRMEYFTEPIYDSISGFGNAYLNGKAINLLYNEPIVENSERNKSVKITIVNGKFGAKRFDGKIILEPKYDEIKSINYPSVLLYRIKDKWGFTNFTNQNIEKPKFDFIMVHESYYGIATIEAYLNKEKLIYNSKGKLVKESDLQKANEYAEAYAQNREPQEDAKLPYLLIFKQNDKAGLKDANGNIIVPAKYKSIARLTDDLYQFSENSFYGMLNKDGKEILPAKYKEISVINSENPKKIIAVFNKEGCNGLFNSKGENIYPFTVDKANQIITIKKGNTFIDYLIITEHTRPIGFDGTPIDDYKDSLLKIENDVMTPLLKKFDGITIGNNNILRYRKNQGFFGLFNCNNEKKTEPIFYNYDYRESGIRNGMVAIDVNKKWVFLDAEFNMLPIDFPIVSYKNNYLVYQNKDKQGLMNEKLEKAKFEYPRITQLYTEPVYYVTKKEDRDWAFSLFKFYTDAKSTKYGIIDFNGKVYIEPNVYDEILYPFYSRNESYKSPKNDVMNQYFNTFFICKTKLNENEFKIDIITINNKKMASFTVSKNWQFNYNLISENHHLIINDQGKIRLINLKTQKTDLELNATNFIENSDGGYSSWGYSYHKNEPLHLLKFSRYGRLIADRSIDIGTNDYNFYLNQFLESKLFISEKNGKFGLVNADEKVILPFENDSLATSDNINYIAKRGSRYGLVNAQNQVLLDFAYDNIEFTGIRNSGEEVKTNVFLVTLNNKKGLFSPFKIKPLIPLEQDEIKLDRYTIARNGKTFSVYDGWNFKFKMDCDDLRLEYKGYSTFAFTKEGKQGRLDYSGKIVNETDTPQNNIPKNNEPISKYKIDREVGDTRLLIVSENGKYGVVDKNDKLVIPLIYDNIRNEGDYFEADLENKDKDKTIFITLQGKVFYEKNEDD